MLRAVSSGEGIWEAAMLWPDPQSHLSLPARSFASKAGRVLTCFTGASGLTFCIFFGKKAAVKVRGYLLIWQMPIEVSFLGGSCPACFCITPAIEEAFCFPYDQTPCFNR